MFNELILAPPDVSSGAGGTHIVMKNVTNLVVDGGQYDGVILDIQVSLHSMYHIHIILTLTTRLITALPGVMWSTVLMSSCWVESASRMKVSLPWSLLLSVSSSSSLLWLVLWWV